MAFTAGSRVQFQVAEEATYGTLGGTPTIHRVPITSTTLGLTKEELTSSELRSDRQISTARHGNRAVAGDVSFELRVGAYDTMLAGVVAGTWTNVAIGVDELEVGVQQRTFQMEVGHTDINQYRLYTGCAINTLNLNVAPNAMVTGTFGVVGRDMTIGGTTVGAGVEPTMTDVVDSFSGQILESGTSIGIATGLELTLDNGVQSTAVIGSPITPQLVWGRSNLSGTLSAYFEDTTLLSKFLNEVETSFSFTLTAGASNYKIDIPRVKFTGASLDVSDEGPVVSSIPWRALLAPNDTNLRITRTQA